MRSVFTNLPARMRSVHSSTVYRLVPLLLFLGSTVLSLGCSGGGDRYDFYYVTTTFKEWNLENSEQDWGTVKVRVSTKNRSYRALYDSEHLEVEYNGHRLPYSVPHLAYYDGSLFIEQENQVFSVRIDPDTFPLMSFYSLSNPVAWPEFSIPDTIDRQYVYTLNLPERVDYALVTKMRGNSELFRFEKEDEGLNGIESVIVGGEEVWPGQTIDFYIRLVVEDEENQVEVGTIGRMKTVYEKEYNKRTYVVPEPSVESQP